MSPNPLLLVIIQPFISFVNYWNFRVATMDENMILDLLCPRQTNNVMENHKFEFIYYICQFELIFRIYNI